jgi:predicted TIM-barrel fold metal-dependent hydrolase
MQTALDRMPIIDVDSHFTEPPDLWVSRAPAKLAAVAPRVVEGAGGGELWVVADGQPLSPPGLCVIRPDGRKAYGTFTLPRFAEMTPAASEVGPRLRAMDELGLALQIVYPNVLGFAGVALLRVQDPALRAFCVSAYNDAVAELQRASGGRLYPQALLPFWDLAAAVRELERSHDELGLTGFTMTDAPEKWGLPSLSDPHWDPLWARAQERGLPCNFHIGSGGVGDDLVWKGMRLDHMIATIAAVLFLHNGRCIANLIFSGLLDRFPRQKFVSVESGIGWIPFLLEACEYQMNESIPDGGNMKLRPTEYFRRQIYASFWFEKPDAPWAIERTGQDNVMFETDFPHPTCLYPDPRGQLRRSLAGLDPAVQRKVLYETAARVYRLPLPKELD